MSNPEDWFDRAREALGTADAVLWARIQQGQWTTMQECRTVMAAHKQVEAAKGKLLGVLDALAFARVAGVPKPPLPHVHVWLPNSDGVIVCTVTGCGQLGPDEPF